MNAGKATSDCRHGGLHSEFKFCPVCKKCVCHRSSNVFDTCNCSPNCRVTDGVISINTVKSSLKVIQIEFFDGTLNWST